MQEIRGAHDEDLHHVPPLLRTSQPSGSSHWLDLTTWRRHRPTPVRRSNPSARRGAPVTFGAQGYALARGEGEGLWFLEGLMTVKAGGPDTRNAFTWIEAECPAGSGPPPHIHHAE